MSKPVLYDYWRSSAAYRVRIALNLKGIAYEAVSVDLLKGEHRQEAHLARNPQGLVPALLIDGEMLTQSLSIIGYLDQTRPEPRLVPEDPMDRARAMTLAYAIAMETHVLSNRRIALHAGELSGTGDEGMADWIRHYIASGLANFEALLGQRPAAPYCAGETPGIADICLVPQMYNAERWDIDMSGLTRCVAINERCLELPEFQAAVPEAVQP